MSSTSLLRIAARAQPSTFFRSNGLRSLTPRNSNAVFALPAMIAASRSASSAGSSSGSYDEKDSADAGHGHEESFEEFTARYATFQLLERGFEQVPVQPKPRNNARRSRSSIANNSCPNIDMRRNSTKSRTSSSFRYALYRSLLFPCYRHGYAKVAKSWSDSNSVISTMPSHMTLFLHLLSLPLH